MFIITAKLSKRKLAMGAAALAAILLAIGAAAGLAGDVAAMGREAPAAAGSAEAAETVQAAASTRARTNEDRVAYLKACGWEVDPDSCEMREVIIPEDFDETYQNYVDLQARQGFDLARLRGKRVKQAIYTVTNYPGGEEVIAELLIYRGNVAAGDICSMKTDGGFTRGLMDHPQKNTDSTKQTQGSGGS